jgi:hypothetical protein
MKVLDIPQFLFVIQEGARSALYCLRHQLYSASLYTKPADSCHCISVSYFPDAFFFLGHITNGVTEALGVPDITYISF